MDTLDLDNLPMSHANRGYLVAAAYTADNGRLSTLRLWEWFPGRNLEERHLEPEQYALQDIVDIFQSEDEPATLWGAL